METDHLQDLRAANDVITRFVSELSARKAPSHPEWNPIQLDSLAATLSRVEKALGSLPPPSSRDGELAKELQKYSVNLRLIKTTIEELGPALEEKMRLTEAALARLGAARNWSKSLKDFSS